MMYIKSCIVIYFLCFTTVLSKDMSCLFRDYKFYVWKSVHSCETHGLIIESANETISNIISYQESHESHESDDGSENHENKDIQLTYDHVLGLYINEQLCNYFPANVKDFFPHLELLQISHSLMNFIEKGNFNGLQELKFVRIISNNISNIPENTFMGAENMIDLKMYSNQIRTIDENAFRGLAKLENLEILKNHISSIELNTFKDLVSLKYLHLSENDIVKLPSKLFETNLKLEKLYIRSNKLTTINVDLFLPLNSLKVANFNGNVCVDIDAPEDMSIDDLKSVIKEECTGVKKIIIPENAEALKPTISVKEIDELKKEINNQIENVVEHMSHEFGELDTRISEVVETQIKNRDDINLLLKKVSLNELLLNETLIKTEQELEKIKLENRMNKSTNVWKVISIIICVVFGIAFIVLLLIVVKPKLQIKNQNFAMKETLIVD
ncbi:unnamed protein product [Diamesa tonsa]